MREEKAQAHRRHDVSDRVWGLLEPHLPGRCGGWGGVAEDNRQFINAVFWILRTGAPWRDLPPDGACPGGGRGWMEQHASPLYPLVRQGTVGEAPERAD